MDLSVIDPRLVDAKINAEDVVWQDALFAPFSLHGVYFDEELRSYRRMPLAAAKAVNPGVRGLSASTAGGRLTAGALGKRFLKKSAVAAASHPLQGGGVMI